MVEIKNCYEILYQSSEGKKSLDRLKFTYENNTEMNVRRPECENLY